MLQPSSAFGRVLGIDVIEVERPTQQGRHWLLDMVDWGTVLQNCEGVGFEKTAEATKRALSRSWVRHHGTPEIVIVDGGGGFKAE